MSQHPKVNDRDYPPVQYITYARDDPDDAPVLDVSKTLAESRRFAEVGFCYRVERINAAVYPPEYGNEQFIEARPR